MSPKYIYFQIYTFYTVHWLEFREYPLLSPSTSVWFFIQSFFYSYV